jgi:hypothetical protein
MIEENGPTGQLVAPDEDELRLFALPQNPEDGHGWCEGGKCWVACDGWKKLVDDKREHITCERARREKWTYKCKGNTRVSTC